MKICWKFSTWKLGASSGDGSDPHRLFRAGEKNILTWDFMFLSFSAWLLFRQEKGETAELMTKL